MRCYCLWYEFCSNMLQSELSAGSIWIDVCRDCCTDCVYTAVKKRLQCLGSWVSWYCALWFSLFVCSSVDIFCQVASATISPSLYGRDLDSPHCQYGHWSGGIWCQMPTADLDIQWYQHVTDVNVLSLIHLSPVAESTALLCTVAFDRGLVLAKWLLSLVGATDLYYFFIQILYPLFESYVRHVAAECWQVVN